MTTPIEALRELVAALDTTNWSSWQTTARFSKEHNAARAVLAQAEAQPATVIVNPLTGDTRFEPGAAQPAAEPTQDLTSNVGWLWTHCRALGMERRSDSGLLHHDVALFVAELHAAAQPAAEPQGVNPEWPRERVEAAAYSLGMRYQAAQPAAEPADFETWWEKHGQFSRAGGGDYEKTFAYNAWQARAMKAKP